MNERRVSLGNRVISLLLALVMVFGMLPAGILSASAAPATSTDATATNVARVKYYASNLLKNNFGKAASEDSDSDSDKFTWDTEGKKTNWRYFTGVMLDAMLMLGVNSDNDVTNATGNALEFAKNFMDTNTENADKAVTHYIPNEVDSVPPALVLFDLLDSAEVTAEDRAIYVKAINYVYEQLEAQTSYDGENGRADCGGNYLHKMGSDSWKFWNIGLDGIYMAQPFLMAYANALEAGDITNTVNSDTAATIYREVYERLMWVADNMYDETTGLYHHGYTVNGGTYKEDGNDTEYEFDAGSGNGVFWGRGIGWYAAGLVMCIDMMPDGTYKNDLIGKLPKLFNGMINYQDDTTGMWYNIVNTTDKVSDTNSNQLETSVTSLMSYALMKAYVEGWVGSTYGAAGLKAFNGLVSKELTSDTDNTIGLVYQKSGVGVTQEYYCKNSYKNNEAKGVGGVLMAASVAMACADKINGTTQASNKYVIGVAATNGDVLVMDGAIVNKDAIKVTLVSEQGDIIHVAGSNPNVKLEVADPSDGKVTITVQNADGMDIDTVEGKVVDTSGTATDEGELNIETELGADETPAAPAVNAGNWETINAGGSGNTSGYYMVTSASDIAEGYDYVLTKAGSSSTQATATVNGTSLNGTKVNTSTNSTVDGKKVYPLATASDSEDPCHWQLTSVDGGWLVSTVINGTTHYIKFTGTSTGDRELTTSESEASVFAFNSGVTQMTTSVPDDDKTVTVYTQIDSGGPKPKTSSQSVSLFQKIPAGDPKYGMLQGSATYAYPVGTSTDILAQIQSDYKVYTNTTNSGTGTEVGWSAATYSWDKTLDTSKAGTYTLTVKVDDVAIGTIPVLIYSNTVTNSYNVTLTVKPSALVLNKGSWRGWDTCAATVENGPDGNYNYIYTVTSGDNDIVYASEFGINAGSKVGNTTLTVTLDQINYNGTLYDIEGVSVTIPVIVTEPTCEHSYNNVVTAPTCTAEGYTTHTCSVCGDTYTDSRVSATGHSYGEYVTTTAPTCTAPGSKSATCSKCDGVDTQSIPATGHSFSNGVCGTCGAADPNYEEPVAPGIESITSSTGKATVASGSKLQLVANVVGGATVTWSSADTNIAEVSDTGLVTGKNPGTVLITATVVTQTRAANSATFEVTVTEASQNPGNISTGSGDGTVDDSAPSFTPGVFVEVKEPTTETTPGSSTNNNGSAAEDVWVEIVAPVNGDGGSTYTHNFTTNGKTSTYYTIKSSNTSTSNGSCTTPDGVTSTTALKISKGSKDLTFTATNTGTLTVIAASGSNDGSSLTINGTEYALQQDKGITTITVENLAAGTYDVTANTKDAYVFYISFAENGSGSGTPGEYAHLDGDKVYTFNAGAYADANALLDDIKANYTIYTNSSESTSGQTAVAWSSSDITIVQSVNVNAADTYPVVVKYKGKTLGTITVAVNTSTEGSTTTTPGVYAKLDGTQGYAYPYNSPSATIIGDIKADDAFKIWVSENADGSGATELALTSDRVEVYKNPTDTPTFTMDAANTYYFGVSVDGVEIGRIPVKIYDNTATGTTWYNGSITLAPGSLNLTAGGATADLTDTLTVVPVESGNATVNSSTITWTSSNQSVATVDQNGKVTPVGAGTATITAKLTAINVNGQTGTIHEDILATATVNVTAATNPPVTGGNKYTHNFDSSKDGMEDADKYFTISGSTSSGGTVDGVSYDQGLKLQSSAGTVSFKAANAGTLTLHVGNNATTVKINGTAYNVVDGVVTAELEAGTHTITKGSGEGYLYYVEWEEENTAPEYSVTITSDQDQILGGDRTTLTAQMLLGDTNVDGATYTFTVTGAQSYAVGTEGNTVTVVANNASGDITVRVVATSGENTAEATKTVTVLPVSATVNGADTVYVDETATYSVTVNPNSNYNVTWSVENGTGSATIDPDTGALTGNTAGTVTVTATVSNIGGSTIGATAEKSVTIQDNVYTVELADIAMDEGTTRDLATAVVKKNGVTITTGYQIVYTLNGTTLTNTNYTAPQVDQNAEHTLVATVTVEGKEVSDTAKLTVYDINFHDTDLWETKKTTPNTTVPEGGKLTFTLDGNLAAGYWGFLDNLKLYKADGTEVAITNGDFESGINGWTVTGFSAVPTSDANADHNKTNRLSLWVSNDAAAEGTATFTVTGLEAGEYYFTYDFLNGTTGSTVTGTATATEAVESNVTVTIKPVTEGFALDTTGNVDWNKGEYIIVFSYSNKLYALTNNNGSEKVTEVTSKISDGVLNMTYTEAANMIFTFDNSDGYMIYNGTAYVRNDNNVLEAAKNTIATVSTINAATGEYGIQTTANRYLYMSSTSDVKRSNENVIQSAYLYKWTESEGEGEATVTDYLVEASGENLTMEAGKDAAPVMTVTGKDMDGNTVTVTGEFDFASANTAIAKIENGKVVGVAAGTTAVTATLKNVKVEGHNGEITQDVTVTFNVVVTPAPVSKDEWIHNVTTDGVTDSDGFYSISKGSSNASTSDTSRVYGDLSFNKAIKMESDTKIEFTAPHDGTFTMIFRTDDAGKGITINDTDYTIASDGTLTIDVEANTKYTVTKDDSVNFFYMEYASAAVDGITVTAPGKIYMLVEGAASGAASHQLQYVVRHLGADVTTGYTITWTSDNETVARVDNTTGKITGIKAGTANITANVTMTDGTQYTATVPVEVVGPAIGTTDVLNLMVDVDSKKTGNIATNVHAAGTTTTNVTLGYLSSDETVATVDENGVVTAVGVGNATIYTYAKTINGHTVYTGTPTVDSLPALYATTTVNVTKREITDAHLNSYDYVIQKGSTMAQLIEVLQHDPHVEGVIEAHEGVHLTIVYNTGEKLDVEANELSYDANTFTATYTDANGGTLTIDLSGIDLSKTVNTETIQYATVTYTKDNQELFRDTIWIHVEEYNPADYDGTMTWEGPAEYILDTDGNIEANEEYVIVANPSTTSGIAIMNPDTTANVVSNAASNNVAITGNKLTIAENAMATAWLFDTYRLGVSCPDNEVRTQLNISNSLSYIGRDNSDTQLIHPNVTHVYLETVDGATGAYRIVVGFNENNEPYYLTYTNGVWQASTTAQTLYLYNKVAKVQDYGVNYELYNKENTDEISGTTVQLINGRSYDKINPVITWGGDNTPAQTYTIVWSSSNESVATVDQNGKVTALSEGTTTITATLYDVDGNMVICNTHNTEHMTQTVDFTVISDNAQPKLTPESITIGQGSMPNLDKVNIKMVYGSGSDDDYFVDHDLLNFRMADAKNAAGETVGFDNKTIGTYIVPVDYAGEIYELTITVVEDPYAGLDEADVIPGYPDAGSVRMDKVTEAVLDFTTTGVTKIELLAAGISTKSSVDVILIVDVSNSMSWDINNSSNSTDAKRIPSDGVDGVTKLDTAMDVADHFADILLNVPGGDNTITFVTFAGADAQHGDTSNLDSVRTPMVGVSDYATASAVFGATEFTALTVDGDGVKCTLNIGGYTGNGYGDASAKGTNRGNTNYDFAFGEAMDAIADLKALYAAENNGKSYDESGRQIQVVFMTDGAPSHYNSKKANGSADTLWSGSGKYTQDDGVNTTNWLAHMKNHNELATQLFAMADGFYTVGFDIDAGGFSSFTWGAEDMGRVLEGLVKNTVLPMTLADNNEALNTYFENLATALAYAGTNAMVTDQIGGNFSLFTGAHMYSSDITAGGIMDEDTLAAMQAKLFPMTVNSYRLVVHADIGSTLNIINENGVAETVEIKESHLGLRVNEEPDALETVYFEVDANGNLTAWSSVYGRDTNILVDNYEKKTRTIDADSFIYTAKLSTMVVDGKTVYHADEENIVWKIGTISDREVGISYYAYLEGSLDNPREAVSGSYATNNFAYLEYIDSLGKYVKREYGVPQVAWGAGNVTVRFFLVNANGQYVNRAGVTFDNPANRIFLSGRAYYEAELNNKVQFTALDALTQAGLAGTNTLYDVTAGATVTNSTDATAAGIGVSWVKDNSLNNIDKLLTYTDSSDGHYTNVVIDIPVVMTDLGESDQKMGDSIVVIDYSNSVQWDSLIAEERRYDGAEYNDVKYTIELVGFVPYSSNADLKDYILAQSGGWPASYSTAYGTFSMGTGDDQVVYTPKAMLNGADHVFGVFKFENLDKDNVGENMEFYYMYKHIIVVPATVVHYETTGNMEGAFQTAGDGWTAPNQGSGADAYQSNQNIGYGFDSSYSSCVNFAGGSALVVDNTDSATRPTVKFTFTGTGIDIIGKTDENQGRIKMTLTGKVTGTTKTVMVLNKGVDNLYQIPVLSVDGLPYDTYEVTIEVYKKTAAYGGKFTFDAINVYGSAQETDVVGSNTQGNITVGSLYESAGESKPQIIEIRDILLGNNSFGNVDAFDVSGAVYIDGKLSMGDGSTNFNDYDKIGPNNEAYLSTDQAIAFKLRVEDLSKLPTTLDIGLKSVGGSAAKAVIYVYKEGATDTTPAQYTVSTATAMFYDILGGENINAFLGNGSNEFYVVIANKGTGTLSVTDLKVAYGTAKGNVETVVDVTVGELAGDALTATANVDSVDIANKDKETNTAIAYSMYTTSIIVVTGKDAQSIEIVDGQGNEVDVKASYVEADNGARRWTVLVRFDEIGTDEYTIYGVGTDGQRDEPKTINIDVKLFAGTTTTN